MLKPVPLGRSGISVAPLGWGMWRFAGADTRTARARVEAALEAGCTLFDTADIYGFSRGGGFGAAESLLGRVLAESPALRRSMVLATKGGIAPPVPYDSSADYLIAACEASLVRLGVECVDLYQVHRPDLLAHPAEVADSLERLRRTGKIRAAGVSNYTASQLEALHAHLPFELASIQPELSPLAIGALSDGVLDGAMRRGLGVLAWSPLAQGRLGDEVRIPTGDARCDAVIAVLDGIATRAGVARSTIVYAWIMAHPARPVPLVGSQRPERIRAARAALTLELARDDWYRVLEAARGAPMP
jgi:predicted oxidoreductase